MGFLAGLFTDGSRQEELETFLNNLPEINIKCKAKCRFGLSTSGYLILDADIEIINDGTKLGTLKLEDREDRLSITIPDIEENKEYWPILMLISKYLQDNIEIEFLSREIPALVSQGELEREFDLEHPYLG